MPHPLIETLPCERERGRLKVSPELAVMGWPGVWALGDRALIPDVTTGSLCPPTAQHALRQGKVVAHNVLAHAKGRQLRKFRFKTIGQLASIGRRAGVASIFGINISGFFAWWMWRTIYLCKLPRLEKKLRVALDWSLDLLFARDLCRSLEVRRERGQNPCNFPRHYDVLLSQKGSWSFGVLNGKEGRMSQQSKPTAISGMQSAISPYAAIPPRAIVGGGFVQHGYAKLTRGPDAFATILQALHVPFPHFSAYLTIGVELLGGAKLLLGAFVALVSIPTIFVLLTAMFTVHLPYGFSSIKIKAIVDGRAQFGPPGYECDLLYVACILTLVLLGASPWSIDHYRLRERSARVPAEFAG